MKKAERLRWHGILRLLNADLVRFARQVKAGQCQPSDSDVHSSVEDYDDPGVYPICRLCRYGAWDYDAYRCEHAILGTRCGINAAESLDLVDCWGFRPNEPWRKVATYWGITVAEAELTATG